MSDQVRAGALAQAELTATEDAFARVRQARIEAWINSDDPAERERLHAAVRVLDDVRTSLRAAVGAGKMAAAREAE